MSATRTYHLVRCGLSSRARGQFKLVAVARWASGHVSLEALFQLKANKNSQMQPIKIGQIAY